MNYLDYIAHYTDVVMHTYIRYKDYTNRLLYIEPDSCMQAVKELQTEAQFGFSVNQLKRLLLADGLEHLEERIQIMGWEMTDTDYKCLLQLNQSEADFYKERLDFYIKELGNELGQEYATRLYSTLEAITWNTACIIEMRAKLLGYVAKSQKQQVSAIETNEIQQHEIPVELQSEMALRLLRWLVESGFLTESYLPTDKLKPKRKLAYLCYKMSKALNLGKNNRGNNKKDISWQPFERLFNTTGLGNNYNQLLREQNYDIKGLYPDIDDFFD